MKDNIKIYDLDMDMADYEPKVVSLGNFDGIHRGHQKLMKKNIEISKSQNFIPSVLLFKQNSKKTLKDEKEHLTSIDDKIEILSDLGIDTFCIIDFNEDFRSLSAKDFISKILYNSLNAKYIIIGEDYKFGKNASGDKETLKKYGDEFSYKTEVLEFELDDGKKISSRTIRDLIKEGKVEKAKEDLGRPYKIRGKVGHGYKRGRTLNFPTANLDLNFSYTIPADGVYLTRIKVLDNYHYGLTNIGSNPTFENKERKIETYILDFNKDIYGKNLSIEFLEFFRGDFKFNSKEELIEQMEKDKNMAYESLKNKYL